jgi:hypothetical protein
MPRWSLVLGLTFVLGQVILARTTVAAAPSTGDSLAVRSIVITPSPELTVDLDALVKAATTAIQEKDEGKRHGVWGAVFGFIMFLVAAVPLAQFVSSLVADKKKAAQNERAGANSEGFRRTLLAWVWVAAALLSFVGVAFVASSIILPIAVLLLALAAWGHLLLAVATHYEQLRWLMTSKDVSGKSDEA